MSYKIVVDSCCELPEEYLQDPRFEIVPLGLEVGDYQIQDGGISEKGGRVSEMSQVGMPFPRAFQGSLPHRSGACVCDHIIIPPQRQL